MTVSGILKEKGGAYFGLWSFVREGLAKAMILARLSFSFS